jgi:L-asparaginase
MEGTPRRVVVIGLGGTIAMAGEAAGANRVGGVVPSLSPGQLVAAVPGLDRAGIELAVEDLRQLPGASLGFDDLLVVSAAVERHLDDGAAGVVVIQGTDTIEESAWFLDLLHGRDQSVVVTGAMRNPTLAGADGPANLLAAIQVAASDEVRGQGCLVVFADEIHAARRVRKTHSSSIGTFRSPTGGPLGYVVAGRPHLLNHLDGRVVLPTRPVPAERPRVPLLTVSLGDDGALLDATADIADGLVVAGFGVGHVPEWMADRLTTLAERLPVVLASRTGAGPVLPSGYGFVGSETHLLDGGLISAGFLDPYKARILLWLLLATHATPTDLRRTLATAGGYARP